VDETYRVLNQIHISTDTGRNAWSIGRDSWYRIWEQNPESYPYEEIPPIIQSEKVSKRLPRDWTEAFEVRNVDWTPKLWQVSSWVRDRCRLVHSIHWIIHVECKFFKVLEDLGGMPNACSDLFIFLLHDLLANSNQASPIVFCWFSVRILSKASAIRVFSWFSSVP
jgi:hypothetical protein